jgi:hypothetical protein
MDLTLIPFAVRRRDGALVGADEVASGKACDCICPSCNTALIARHGSEKTWHFAHVSLASGDITERACEFSWAASVRRMARQLLPGLGSIKLPDAVFPLFTDGLARPPPGAVVTVVTASTMDTASLVVDSVVEQVSVDAAVVDGPSGWCIYLEHHGRQAPEVLAALGAMGYSVIAINLHGYASSLLSLRPGGSHRIALADWLQNDLTYKRWVAHPGLSAARREGRASRLRDRKPPSSWERDMIERRRASYPSLRTLHAIEDPSPASLSSADFIPAFECMPCGYRGQSRAITPRCPRCGRRMTPANTGGEKCPDADQAGESGCGKQPT